MGVRGRVKNLRTGGLKDFKTGGYFGGGTFAGKGVSTPLNTMGRGLEKLGHLDKGFSNTLEKEMLQENILKFFLLDAYKTTFWMENLTPKLTQSGPFFQNQDTFLIFKKGRGDLPFSPGCVSVSGWICIKSLNMPKYLWKYLDRLFWLCQCSEYAWSSYMFDRLLKMPLIGNVPGFWVWHGCICKGYIEF